VAAIMMPRHDIEWVDLHATAAELREHLIEAHQPRVLVCDGELDTVVGIAFVEELLAEALAGHRPDLRHHARAPLFVPATLSVFALLEQFRASHLHVALVLDEFGAIEGLVTATDILEGLVGEIPSKPSDEPGPVVQRDERSWLVDGATPVEDLASTIELPPIPESEQGTYNTLAGLVMTRLARVPHAGDRFTWGRFRIEVVDMDGRRIDKVLIERLEPAAADDGNGGRTAD
jgi:putative hemolysin